MQKLLLAVDRLSSWVGQAFAWAIVLLTALITWEVFSRYALNEPHDWALNAQIMLYGLLFMSAGAYTLAKNGHVRGDVLYGFFQPRTQATVDLVLYLLFFLPGIFALTWAGWDYALESLAIREKTFSATPLPLYPFKFVIPFSGAMLLLQGLVEIIRCIACIRDGEWPSREQDVEEVDVEKLKKMAGGEAVRTGGKGSVRRKKKAVHKTTTTDDKRLQNTLKRLGVNTIPGIEEVNIFKDDDVIHFTNPKVQASIAANTYVISGPSQTKKLQDLLPGILNQMGPDSLTNLKRMMAQMGAGGFPGAGAAAADDDDDDVPDLVENFEEAAK